MCMCVCTVAALTRGWNVRSLLPTRAGGSPASHGVAVAYAHARFLGRALHRAQGRVPDGSASTPGAERGHRDDLPDEGHARLGPCSAVFGWVRWMMCAWAGLSRCSDGLHCGGGGVGRRRQRRTTGRAVARVGARRAGGCGGLCKRGCVETWPEGFEAVPHACHLARAEPVVARVIPTMARVVCTTVPDTTPPDSAVEPCM
jgi:hypothetical protein